MSDRHPGVTDEVALHLPSMTPEAESTLDDLLYAWEGQERQAMVIAYNLGRRHECARWLDKIRTAFDWRGGALHDPARP